MRRGQNGGPADGFNGNMACNWPLRGMKRELQYPYPSNLNDRLISQRGAQGRCGREAFAVWGWSQAPV